eukprot:g61474.t1
MPWLGASVWLLGLVCAIDNTSAPPPIVTYKAEWGSLDSRATPRWFGEAKLGVLLHWGLYSVPAFAPTTGLKQPANAEWYWHSVTEGKRNPKNASDVARLTWEHHKAVYGADFPYAKFVEHFKAELFQPEHWAEVLARSGAKYVVLTAKHHDGFALWPSKQASESWTRPWTATEIGPRRDLFGELSDAVRRRRLRMGAYFSLLEWYNPTWTQGRSGALALLALQPAACYVDRQPAFARPVHRQHALARPLQQQRATPVHRQQHAPLQHQHALARTCAAAALDSCLACLPLLSPSAACYVDRQPAFARPVHRQQHAPLQHQHALARTCAAAALDSCLACLPLLQAAVSKWGVGTVCRVCAQSAVASRVLPARHAHVAKPHKLGEKTSNDSHRGYVKNHMIPQFKDLVRRYKPELIFSDGDWPMPSSEWQSAELLEWLFNQSPVRDEVVVNDGWGNDCRHKHGGYFSDRGAVGSSHGQHPWELSKAIGVSYGYNRAERVQHYHSLRDLLVLLVDVVARGGNLLLGVGPRADGELPPLLEERLLGLGRWLAVNGEAIYGTRPWHTPLQWSGAGAEGGGEQNSLADLAAQLAPDNHSKPYVQAFFTRKGSELYAIMPHWDPNKAGKLGLNVTGVVAVYLLGGPDAPLSFRQKKKKCVVTLPSLRANSLHRRCGLYGWCWTCQRQLRKETTEKKGEGTNADDEKMSSKRKSEDTELDISKTTETRGVQANKRGTTKSVDNEKRNSKNADNAKRISKRKSGDTEVDEAGMAKKNKQQQGDEEDNPRLRKLKGGNEEEEKDEEGEKAKAKGKSRPKIRKNDSEEEEEEKAKWKGKAGPKRRKDDSEEEGEKAKGKGESRPKIRKDDSEEDKKRLNRKKNTNNEDTSPSRRGGKKRNERKARIDGEEVDSSDNKVSTTSGKKTVVSTTSGKKTKAKFKLEADEEETEIDISRKAGKKTTQRKQEDEDDNQLLKDLGLFLPRLQLQEHLNRDISLNQFNAMMMIDRPWALVEQCPDVLGCIDTVFMMSTNAVLAKLRPGQSNV